MLGPWGFSDLTLFRRAHQQIYEALHARLEAPQQVHLDNINARDLRSQMWGISRFSV